MFDFDELDNLNMMQKRRLIALANTHQEQLDRDNEILKSVDKLRPRDDGHNVVSVLDDIAVLKYEHGKSSCVGLYTYKVLIDGKWTGMSNYYHTPVQAFLGALGEKYVGRNNDFEFYAGKMLGIDIEKYGRV